MNPKSMFSSEWINNFNSFDHEMKTYSNIQDEVKSLKREIHKLNQENKKVLRMALD